MLTRMGELDTPMALVTMLPPPDVEQLAVYVGVPLGDASVKLIVALPPESTEIELIDGVPGALPPPPPPPPLTTRVPLWVDTK
jgi:hypothetical protein